MGAAVAAPGLRVKDQISVCRFVYLSLRGAVGDVAIPWLEGKSIEMLPKKLGDCHTSLRAGSQ
jgi:hypothetical protein